MPDLFLVRPIFRSLRLAIPVTLGIGWMTSCQPVPEGEIAARVGDRQLTVHELEARIPVHVAGRIGPSGRRRAAEEWVEEELLIQEARRLKLDEDLSVAERLERMRRDLLIMELLERRQNGAPPVTEQDIQSYYDINTEDFFREEPEIRARHILVKTRSEVRKLQARLKEGELLDQLAREASIDVSAEDGGDLGYFTEDMVSAPFWEACRKASLGRQELERTPLGYHILEVLDRRDAGTSKDLSEVRPEIRQQLMLQRLNDLRQSLLMELRGRVEWQVVLAVPSAPDEADFPPRSGGR